GGIDAVITTDPDAAADQAAFAADLRIDGSVLDDVNALDEVDAAAGDLTGSAAIQGDDGRAEAEGATARLWVDDERLNPTTWSTATRPRPPARSRSTAGPRTTWTSRWATRSPS
ncbi:MAG: hypothetical protein KDA97_14905, partial [Acidimicrobiales bacterium]|nr:hypothetical protein [Acidimicrobiales bacterium]